MRVRHDRVGSVVEVGGEFGAQVDEFGDDAIEGEFGVRVVNRVSFDAVEQFVDGEVDQFEGGGSVVVVHVIIVSEVVIVVKDSQVVQG